MNFSMYTDSSKNLMMVLPDGIPDEMVFAIGLSQATAFEGNSFVDLTNPRVDFNVTDFTPSELVFCE